MITYGFNWCGCHECERIREANRNKQASIWIYKLQNRDEKPVQNLNDQKESEMDANEKLVEASRELARAAQDLRNAADALSATFTQNNVKRGDITPAEMERAERTFMRYLVTMPPSGQRMLMDILEDFARLRGLV